MTKERFSPLRIAIVGSCQVVGLAAAANAFLPGSEVRTWHVGVHPKDSDEELLAQLPGFDVVISQIADQERHAGLGITRLRACGLPVVFVPVLAFQGFHPDMTYIHGPAGPVRGPESDYHSVIIASAFLLGLSPRRVPDLFNAYIYAQLGYFDVFESAKAALFTKYDEHGIDLRAPFAFWLKQAGQFMYSINHPNILVLATLCRMALAAAGHLDPDAPIPEGIPDFLVTDLVWPIYPELAKRIGIRGSTLFQRSLYWVPEGGSRDLPLAAYTARCFESYSGVPPESLRVGAVAEACRRLSRVVMAG
jgi:hypothetical protein